MSDISFRHGPEFQRCVIKTMIQDCQFCAKAVQFLKDDFFSGELSWFNRKMRESFEQYKRPPLDGEIKSEISKHGDGAPKYEKEYQLILSADGVGKEFLRKEITAFIRANIFVSSVTRGADLYNSGDRQGCYDFLKTKMNDLYDADFESDRMVKFDNLDEIMDEARTQSRDAIPTGIKMIDDVLYGGMMPQTWTTFIGGSNVGKSMLCPNLAKAAYDLKRKKSLVLVHEDEEVPTQIRYLACFSEVPYNRLLLPRSDLGEDEIKRINEAKEILKEYVRIRFMYSKEAFVETVCNEARRIKDQWEYHLLLDDYLQCLKVKSFKSMEDTYTLHEFNTQELKQLCCELRVAGAGGAQTNRTGHKINRSGSDYLRCHDVGDSWGIVKKSSNVITMNRSESDIQNNRITFLLDKGRNAERCPLAVQCYSRYDRCQTHIRYSEKDSNQTEVPICGGKNND